MKLKEIKAKLSKTFGVGVTRHKCPVEAIKFHKNGRTIEVADQSNLIGEYFFNGKYIFSLSFVR